MEKCVENLTEPVASLVVFAKYFSQKYLKIFEPTLSDTETNSTNRENSQKFEVASGKCLQSPSGSTWIKDSNPNFIRQVNGWQVEVAHLEQNQRKVGLLSNFLDTPIMPTKKLMESRLCTSEMFCEICSDRIEDSDGGIKLEYCNHSFCIRCWLHYLFISIKYPSAKAMACPVLRVSFH